MGNMNARRDWGHARDYVRMQWLMLQQDAPEDFVIASGQQYSVREFIQWAAADLGIALRFEGEGTDEVGRVESVAGDDAPAVKPGLDDPASSPREPAREVGSRSVARSSRASPVVLLSFAFTFDKDRL